MPANARQVPADVRKLAECRAARGLTQTALARQVGVSRQFFNQMESGRVLPNVVIALRLATALETTVEELFGTLATSTAELVAITPARPGLAVGTRLRLGRVGRRWIAHPADTPGSLAAGFASADAVLEAPDRARLLVDPVVAAGNLLIAGCDPAVALLQPPPGGEGGGRCHWIDCSSGVALDLLDAGLVHVAGLHYAGADGAGNRHELQHRDPSGKWSLVRFTRWEQGWLLRRGEGRKFAGVADLGTGRWRLANRAESTAARRWLDRELAAAAVNPACIPGYTAPLASAPECAQAVTGGRADVAVGPHALALAHSLSFIAAEAVDFDLAAPAVWWRSAAGRGLKSRIADLARTGAWASLPGYVATQAGTERVRGRSRRGRA